MHNRSHIPRRLNECISAEAGPCPGLGRRSGPCSCAAASRCSGSGRWCRVERLILVRLGRLHVAAAGGTATPAVGTALRTSPAAETRVAAHRAGALKAARRPRQRRSAARSPR
jgi:hypothetical protein